MEEPIWLIVGIIMVLISIAIIVQLVTHHNKQSAGDVLFDSLKKLEIQCNMVCSSAEGTLLSIGIEIPGNSKITSNTKSICAIYNDKRECVRCSCNLNNYVLDLTNTSIARKIVKHKYHCFFEKNKNNLTVECKG
jgi:hypothetical protein